jgi:hypothetical protein
MTERRRRAVSVALDGKTVLRTPTLPEPHPRVIIWRRRVFTRPYRGYRPGEPLLYLEAEPFILRDPPDTSGPSR